MKLALTHPRRSIPVPSLPKYPLAIAAAAAALGIAALINRSLAKKAERDNPPAGKFMNVGNVKLHYVDRGSGEPLILLHGNGSMIQDFASSGLIEMASQTHRVIAFDRPGFGHSARPRGTIWTPEAQADLIHLAMKQTRHHARQGPRSFLGSVGRSCTGFEAPRGCCQLNFGLGILLSHSPHRRTSVVRTGGPDHRRYLEIHSLASSRQASLATLDAKDIWAGEDAGQV